MSTGSNANFKVLGLSSDASWDEVKAAFRRLARLYHPDVAGPEGARKFAEITEAYMTLKETIAPGGSRAGGGASASSRAAEHAAETGEARESFFARFWRKLKALFTFAKKERVEAKAEEDAYEYDIPPARIRFIGGIISRAEADIYNLLSLRGEVKSRTRTDAILRRLRSRHPSVVMLALKGLAPRDANEEIKAAIVDHFKKQMPTSEVLESLLAFSSGTSMVWDFAKSLTEHSNDYSQNDALLILKWMKRHKVLSG